MKVDEIIGRFEGKDGLKNVEKRGRRVWLTVDRESFKDFVEEVYEIQEDAHFSVCTGTDLGESVELIYYFSLNFRERHGEIYLGIRVSLPKDDLKIQTITDVVKGAQISEREIQEMLGVKVEGTPDARRLFLDEDFPEETYPWRRDEKGPDKITKNFHEGDENE